MKTINFVSFNANSLRVRMHQIEKIIAVYQPEVIGIQETKVEDSKFPEDEIRALGYHSYFSGQPTHYGVALLSKTPLTNVGSTLEGHHDQSQKRFICADLQRGDHTLHVINTYFPQGENREHPSKFANKLAFYDSVTQHLISQRKHKPNIVLLGDLNVAPADDDVQISESSQKRWLKTGTCSFLPEERDKFMELLDQGMVDPYTTHRADDTHRASWFDYRNRGFSRSPKSGLRIDFTLVSEALSPKVESCSIDHNIRGMDKPSDHCPVIVSITV